jgi:hypothetical protein
MKDYSDILNRKKTSDKLGDAFTDQANSMRPMNVGQRREQALLRGLGVGLNSDDERETKLAELENMSKELSMNKYALEMQSGKNELTKQKNLAFFNENQAALSQLSEYIYAGKHSEVDMLAPEILKSYGDITGNKIGKFNHYKNGYATFIDDSGEPKTINIKNLIQPVMDLLPPDQKKEYRGFLSPLQNADIDRMVKAQELQMEKYQADIEASKAHAELYKSQAEKAKMEAQNPMSKKEQETILTTNITSNRKYIEEKLDPKLEASENILTAYDRLGKIAIETPNLVGSDYLTKVRRTLGEVFGLDPNLDYAKLSNVDFEKMLRPILGAQFTKDEGNRILAKLPSIEKNRKALLQFLKEDRPKLIKSIVKMKAQKNTYNKNNAINILDENQLGDINNDYNMFVKDRYGIEQGDLNLVVDTNSKEYNTYKNKGATGN